MTPERALAESKCDQNLAAYATDMREVLAASPAFFTTFNEILNMNNVEAAKKINLLSSARRRFFLEYAIPAARIGFMKTMFEIEDRSIAAEETE